MSNSVSKTKVTRRGFLRTQAALAAAAAAPVSALAATTTTHKPAAAAGVDYYDKLGVKTFLNAAGTYTDLTSACMPDVVQAAVAQAAKKWVHIRELQQKAGAYIAERLKAEGCAISAGAASALQLAAAACIQAANPGSRPLDIPRNIGTAKFPKNEIITQTPYGYDEGMVMCGAKIIVVNNLEEYKAAFNERTVMTNFENAAEVVKIPVEDWLAVAKEHGVPCHLDAAADMPPISNLWTLAQKWDLVCFSGGKGIRGPQSAGLLLGKKKYTDLANNMLPPAEGPARGMKVAKEQIVGMVAAVDWILSQTDESLFKESNDRLAVIAAAVKDIPSVKTRVIVPAVANHYPQLVVEFDPKTIGATPQEIKARLATGTPAIEINPHTGATRASQGVDPMPNALVITAMLLFPGQDKIVGAQVRKALKDPKSVGSYTPGARPNRG